MILCEPKSPKLRRDPYERSLAELRLFPYRNPAAMHSAGYARLGIFPPFLVLFCTMSYQTRFKPLRCTIQAN